MAQKNSRLFGTEIFNFCDKPSSKVYGFALSFHGLQSLFCAATTTSKTPTKTPQKHRLKYLKNTD